MTDLLRRRMTILALALMLVPWSSALADDPAAILSGAGLKRIQNSYVLEGELQARELETQYGKIEQRYARAVGQKQEAQGQYAEIQQQVAQLKSQAAQLRAQGGGGGGGGGGGRGRGRAGGNLSQQAQQLEAQAKALQERIQAKNSPLTKQNADADKQIAAESKEMEALQTKFKALVDQTKAKYDDLAGRPEIHEALVTLNKGVHPMAVLGPIPAYKENVTRFCSDRLRELGLENDNGSVHPAGEGDLAKAIGTARLKLLQAEKQKKLDDVTKSDLRTTASELRVKVDELEALRDKFAKDQEIDDLVDELQRVAGPKKKVRLGSLAAYTRALKELEAVEEASGGRGASAGGRP